MEHTPEPEGRGGDSSADDGRFVIQKHAASSLHYDLRLAFDGSLKSWAIPKGPSTDPREKRLAIRTEDHPLDYAGFEGVIPEDQYGGGTVMVWDRGCYRNLRADKDDDCHSMIESLRDGLIEVWLKGEKLIGGYALKRIRNDDDNEQWLLIKMRDEEADARRNPTSTENRSVLSDRTLGQIAKHEQEGEGKS